MFYTTNVIHEIYISFCQQILGLKVTNNLSHFSLISSISHSPLGILVSVSHCCKTTSNGPITPSFYSSYRIYTIHPSATEGWKKSRLFNPPKHFPNIYHFSSYLRIFYLRNPYLEKFVNCHLTLFIILFLASLFFK